MSIPPSVWVLAYIFRVHGKEGEWPQVMCGSYATEAEARAVRAMMHSPEAYQVCRIELPTRMQPNE